MIPAYLHHTFNLWWIIATIIGCAAMGIIWFLGECADAADRANDRPWSEK